MNILYLFINNESGQGLIEYSLIISLVTIAVIGSIILFGDEAYIFYEAIKKAILNVL